MYYVVLNLGRLEVSMKSSSIFINELSMSKQTEIKKLLAEYLSSEGYNDLEAYSIIKNAMCDRICLLEEFISIDEFLM